MFKALFGRDQDIYAPVKGRCIDITKVPDAMFSGKMLSDGVAVMPTEEVICSPMDGTLVMIAETNHAFGIESKERELLIHIGIDTVELKGLGFEALKEIGSKIKHGEPIIRLNKKVIPDTVDLTTMVIVTKGNLSAKAKPSLDKEVTTNDVILG